MYWGGWEVLQLPNIKKGIKSYIRSNGTALNLTEVRDLLADRKIHLILIPHLLPAEIIDDSDDFMGILMS